MTTHQKKCERFAAMHRGATPLLLANPWDAGSARVLVSIGFQALATTSAGFAGTLGRLDGAVTRDEALAHCAVLAAATDVPISADLENGFADDPDRVAETIRGAVAAGLAGCSVEDHSGKQTNQIYDIGLAVERISAAVEAAHAGPARLVVTARAENHIRGNPDLSDTIARLQAFQAAGADVVYAPGLSALADIEQVVKSVDVPVNVLAMPGTPTVAELGAAGVARISVGGAFSSVATRALAVAGREFLERGTYDFWGDALQGMQVAREAYTE